AQWSSIGRLKSKLGLMPMSLGIMLMSAGDGQRPLPPHAWPSVHGAAALGPAQHSSPAAPHGSQVKPLHVSVAAQAALSQQIALCVPQGRQMPATQRLLGGQAMPAHPAMSGANEMSGGPDISSTDISGGPPMSGSGGMTPRSGALAKGVVDSAM